MSHQCHAVACAKLVPPSMLMCGRHWRMVPQKVQRAVWRTYRAGQEVDKRPSALYLLVQAVAVGWVAHVEGRFTREQMGAHVLGRLEQLRGRPDEPTKQDVDQIVAIMGVEPPAR